MRTFLGLTTIKHVAAAFAVLVSGVFASSLVLAPAATYAAPKDEVCNAIGAAGCNANEDKGTDIQKAITFVVNLLSVIAGLAAVIMLILGGIKYVTSGGDSSKVASAKNTIIYALVGLVIAALAQVLVHFVLKEAAGVGN